MVPSNKHYSNNNVEMQDNIGRIYEIVKITYVKIIYFNGKMEEYTVFSMLLDLFLLKEVLFLDCQTQEALLK